MPSPIAACLLALAGRRAARAGRDWLAAAADPARGAADRSAFLAAFAIAARRLGTAPLAPAAAEVADLAAAGVDWPLAAWRVDEAGRAALLALAGDRLAEAEHLALVEEAYRHGDTRERQAVLRALPLLDRPARFVPLGVDACRSHVQPVFEAIACENPFPVRHFPDLHWNQMVLKALFTEVPLDRVFGLASRRSPELARMAADYARERRLAGRSVPADVERLTGGVGTRSPSTPPRDAANEAEA
ncbi:MAG TPA: EboA domain-containing protein [Thermodesulfobacteriota bacterium]